MKKVRVYILAVLVTALCFGIVWAVPETSAAEAADHQEKVRIGFFDAVGYQEVKKDGTLSGYGYEYYKQLEKYTDWTSEYVTGYSWDECLAMLERGELDMVGFAQFTEERKTRFAYSALPMGESYTGIYAKNTDRRFGYEDFEAFNGMTVGVIKGTNHEELFKAYCNENGFSVNLTYFPDQPSLVEGLRSGQADAVVSTILKRGADAKLIGRFNPTAFYILTNKDNTQLQGKLNAALSQIKMVNPSFDSELYEKYFPASVENTAFFTKEERRFLANSPPLRVAYLRDRPPITYYGGKTHGFSGISADIFSFISEMTGLRFTYIAADSNQEISELMSSGKADIAGCFDKNYNLAAQNGLSLSDAYLSAPFLMITNKAGAVDGKEQIALASSLSNMTEELNLTETNVTSYPDIEACFEALRGSKAAVTYANSYVANKLLLDPIYADFSVTTLAGHMNESCIAVSKSADPLLLRVLNKAIHSTSTEKLNDIIVSNTMKPTEITFSRLLHQRPEQVVVALTVFFVLIIGTLCSILFIRSSSNEKIQELLYEDPLTRHWNFNKFRIEATKVLEDEQRPDYVVLYLDIDRFKYINDTFGYSVGDRVLRKISEILRGFVGEDEMFARMSADSFVVLMKYDSEEHLLEKLGQFEKELEEISSDPGREYRFILLGGVYVLLPEDIELTTMIDRANLARETAVGIHRSTFTFYNDMICDELKTEKEMEKIMESAMEQGDFIPYLQPKVDITSKEVVGAEALARWRHEKYGIIPPGRFIPLFEKNGFIATLDFYIYEEVCRMVSSWRRDGKKILPISCNFSRIHISDISFPERLLAIAQKYEVPTEYLELEITESVAMDNPQQTIMQIDKLKQMGFQLAIDDFGAGYSSLGMLQTLPMDVLKLDKSFLQKGFLENRERAILQGVVSIADSLSMIVICEGVETSGQLDLLQEIGCHLAQGFLYAKPMPVKEFEETFLTENKDYWNGILSAAFCSMEDKK